MQLVSDRENIWDLIGNEQSFKDGDPNALLTTDAITLEKEQFIQDSKFLDKIIQFSSDGKMSVTFQDAQDYQQLQKMLKNKQYLDNSQSSSSDKDSPDERTSNLSAHIQYKPFRRAANDDCYSHSSQQLDFYLPATGQTPTGEKRSDGADVSENSVSKGDAGSNLAQNDKPTEQKNDSLTAPGGLFKEQKIVALKSAHQDLVASQTSQNQLSSSANLGMNIGQVFITDEEEELILIESRIHQALKRNVLRDTMSEDLEWANCIKNEGEDLDRLRFEQSARVNIQETRSLQSTPERVKDSHREKSCDRIFGSASSRRRFKKSSRINSRRSSMSSNMQRGLNKSKSKDQLHQIGSSSVFLESKSIQLLNKDGSKTKRYRDSSRDSYDSHILGRQSLGNIQPRTLFFSKQEGSQLASFFDETTKDDFSVGQQSNFGSQMNQLITSMKPQSSLSFVSFRLSQNALRYIFPIREQKILIKRPGKDGQFAKARVVIKLEDLNQISPHIEMPPLQRPSLSSKEQPAMPSEPQAQPV